MIWGLIFSCLICNRPVSDDVWIESGPGESGWVDSADSGCEPWIAVRDEADEAVELVDFGTLEGPGSVELPVALFNREADCGVLRVSEIVTTAPFALTGTAPSELAPGERVELLLSFEPSEPGLSQGVLSIASNDPFYPTLVLPMQGTLSPGSARIEPSDVDFGEVLAGCPERDLSVLSNLGDTQVTLTEVQGQGVFTVDAGGLPQLLEVGSELSVTVSFAPPEPGLAEAELTLMTTAGPLPMALSGEGVFAPEVSERILATESDTYALAEQPVEQTLKVRVSGVLAAGWSYVPEENAVRFDPESQPDTGTELRISYSPAVDCPE